MTRIKDLFSTYKKHDRRGLGDTGDLRIFKSISELKQFPKEYEICKKVLDMVLNGASHKSNVQKPEIKDENPEIIKLFGEKKAKQVDVAIAALKNVTPPTETSKHRNSFSGFIQRYAILKEAIKIADKGND